MFSLLVHKMERIKSFLTGLQNEQKSNERRVASLENFLFPAHKFNIHKNVDRVYVEGKAHISNNMKNTQKTHFRKIYKNSTRNPRTSARAHSFM